MVDKRTMRFQIGQKVISFAPASVANVGPCYDIMGYCLDYLGDFAEAKITNDVGKLRWIGMEGPGKQSLEGIKKEYNAAYAVAKIIWEKYWKKKKCPFGIELILHKYMPVSSGLGSSAASGVAAGKLLLEVLDLKLSLEEVCKLLVVSEKVTANAPHLDNVIPSFAGGFFLLTSSSVRHVGTIDKLISVVVTPNLEIPTSLARQKIHQYIIETYINTSNTKSASIGLIELIKKQSALAAQVIMAVEENNPKALGETMNNNDFLENARSPLIPNFQKVKENAKKAGAYGCSIAGAGPSVVAITSSIKKGYVIRDAMINAFSKIKCNWLISPINNVGARIITSSIENEIRKGLNYHNFYEV